MKNKINAFNLAMITLALNKSIFLGVVFSFLFNKSNTSTIWSVLIGSVLSVLLYFILLKIMSIYPNESIFGKIKKVFPKLLSNIFILLINICVFILGTFLLWRASSFISTEFLTKTSTVYILLLMILPIAYLSTKNIDVLGRFSFIAIIICFIIIYSNFVGVLPQADFLNIKPFFNDPILKILESAMYYCVFFSTPAFLVTMVKKNDLVIKEKFNKYIWIFFIESAISTFAIFFAVLSVLGVELISLYTYPEFVILKIISLFNFIENVENICTMLWILYLIISISTCFMFIKQAFIEKFNIETKKKKKIIALLIASMSSLVVYFARDYSYYIDKFKFVNFLFYICLTIILIMFTLLCTYLIKKTIKKIKLII